MRLILVSILLAFVFLTVDPALLFLLQVSLCLLILNYGARMVFDVLSS